MPGKNWTNQKEHLIWWLFRDFGPGYYNRQSRNWTAKDAYNHLQCAPALLWLADALGENPETLTRAVDAGKAAPQWGSSQCAVLRRVISWQRIEQLIRDQ